MERSSAIASEGAYVKSAMSNVFPASVHEGVLRAWGIPGLLKDHLWLEVRPKHFTEYVS